MITRTDITGAQAGRARRARAAPGAGAPDPGRHARRALRRDGPRAESAADRDPEQRAGGAAAAGARRRPTCAEIREHPRRHRGRRPPRRRGHPAPARDAAQGRACSSSRSTSTRLIREVLLLERSDLIARHVAVAPELAPDLPQVHGDRVQLQQVVLNLVLNACEAMSADAGRRAPPRAGHRPRPGGSPARRGGPAAPASRPTRSSACSSRSSPPRSRGSAWACRSAARSSKRTADGCGRATTRRAARRSISRCRPMASALQPERRERAWDQGPSCAASPGH